MRTQWLVIATSVALACGAGLIEPEVGQEFRLRVGHRARIAAVGLVMEFARIGEDSRCPTRVQCVWAGNAAAVVEWVSGPEASAVIRTDTLNTNEGPELAELGELDLVLVRLDPYPETPGSILTDQYEATFVVRRR